jgi:hypothetical protein
LFHNFNKTSNITTANTEMCTIVVFSLILQTAGALFLSSPFSSGAVYPSFGRQSDLFRHGPHLFKPPMMHRHDVNKMFDNMRSDMMRLFGGGIMERQRLSHFNPFHHHNLLSQRTKPPQLISPLHRQLIVDDMAMRKSLHEREKIGHPARTTQQQQQQQEINVYEQPKSKPVRDAPLHEPTTIPETINSYTVHAEQKKPLGPTLDPTPPVDTAAVAHEDTHSPVPAASSEVEEEAESNNKQKMRRMKQAQYRKAQEEKKQLERERAQRDLDRRLQMEREHDDFIVSVVDNSYGDGISNGAECRSDEDDRGELIML